MAHIIKTGNTVFTSGGNVFGAGVTGSFSQVDAIPINSYLSNTPSLIIGLAISYKYSILFQVDIINNTVIVRDLLTLTVLNTITGFNFADRSTSLGGDVSVDDDNDTLYVSQSNARKIEKLIYTDPRGSIGITKTLLFSNTFSLGIDYYNRKLYFVACTNAVGNAGIYNLDTLLNDFTATYSYPQYIKYDELSNRTLIVARNTAYLLDGSMSSIQTWNYPSGSTYFFAGGFDRGSNRILLGTRNASKMYVTGYAITSSTLTQINNYQMNGFVVDKLYGRYIITDGLTGYLRIFK